MKINYLILFILGLFAAAAPVNAQVTPTSAITLTNLPTYVVGGATSNSITTQTWDFRQDKGFAVYAAISGTNAASVQDVTFNFAPGYDDDGTIVYATTNFMSLAVSGNGTTTNRGFKVFGPPDWNNVRKVKLYSIVNGMASTNKAFLGDVVIDVGN